MAAIEANYWRDYHNTYDSLMAKKLGLTLEDQHELSPEESTLIKDFFQVMQLTSNDMTNTFRDLAQVNSIESDKFADKIMSHAASKEIKLNGTKSKWASNKQILMIL